jgi:Golgi apparatus protein 1
MDDGDEGQVMECLVEYKMNTETTMNSKCRAAVEHFQLIALQDFRFSAPFKRACKQDISRLCPNIKEKYVITNFSILMPIFSCVHSFLII